MSNAMSRSKSRWKSALLAGAAMAVLSPLAAKAQSLTLSVVANPLGVPLYTTGSGSPPVAGQNDYNGYNNVYIDPYSTDHLYVYATVTGTAAPSPTYVDGLSFAYFNVNAIAAGTGWSNGSLGAITTAIPSNAPIANFGGGNFNGSGGNLLAGAQSGNVSGVAYTTSASVAVGSTTVLSDVAKPRSPSNGVFWNQSTGSGSNVIVNGNSVSFLVETLTYTPNAANIALNPTNPGLLQSVAFNLSIPAIATTAPYVAANYWAGLSSTPAFDTQPSVNASTGATASATTVTMTNALAGDVNLDGTINGGDLAVITSIHYNTAFAGGWPVGDLNNDGIINGGDLALVTSINYNTAYGSAPSGLASSTAQIGGSSSVPEPASLGLIALVGLGLLRRRASTLK